MAAISIMAEREETTHDLVEQLPTHQFDQW